jgi:alkylation response protein AidB-like acyl-CoA dehydrogenase
MDMSHYRSNLRDLHFNLFEVHRFQDYLGGEHFPGLDPDTVRDVLDEVDRLASDQWAASFSIADRHPPELVDGEVRLPIELKESIQAFQAGGWDRFGLPAEVGGTEVPQLLFWATQELFLGANPTAMFYAGGNLFARVILEEGTPRQQELARRMVERRWAGTMVLTEPDAGSDVGAATTRATRVEDDVYHLEGVKRFITGGDHDSAENIIHLVLARPQGAGPGTKGLSLFIVPKFLVNPDGSLGDRNGIVATKLEHKLGLRGSATCELTLGGSRPAVGYLLGGVHDGIRQMFRVITHARMTIGTKSAATLSTGYLNALAFARERVQGPDLAQATQPGAPRVPIIRHPDVRRMLMIQKAHAEGLRALWTYAAWVGDQSRLQGDEEPWARLFDLLLPIVKGYSSEKAHELLASCLQVLGGSGYLEDYPIEQYLRDAKVDSIYEGTTGIQALDLFFRKVVKDQGETVAFLFSLIGDFVKATGDGDPLAGERELLADLVEDVQAHLGTAAGHLYALAEEPERIYLSALHLTPLLESLAETVIAWQLLRHAEVAMGSREDDPFFAGKVASARFFIRHVGPKVAARRVAAVSEDGWLMDLAVESF